jgi:hypothetical protein
MAKGLHKVGGKGFLAEKTFESRHVFISRMDDETILP